MERLKRLQRRAKSGEEPVVAVADMQACLVFVFFEQQRCVTNA